MKIVSPTFHVKCDVIYWKPLNDPHGPPHCHTIKLANTLACSEGFLLRRIKDKVTYFFI